jgi:hypothetical protein
MSTTNSNLEIKAYSITELAVIYKISQKPCADGCNLTLLLLEKDRDDSIQRYR